jgi:hypothetical protein
VVKLNLKLTQCSSVPVSNLSLLMTAGRRNSEKGRDGDMCAGTCCTLCGYAICICAEKDTWVLMAGKNWDFFIQTNLGLKHSPSEEPRHSCHRITFSL